MAKTRGCVPKKMKPTNSGMFSKSGAGQKLDPPIKTDVAVKRAYREAYKNTNSRPGG